mgnify:CR=1 FL=1
MKRKPRDTSYSATQRLIARFGIEKLRREWQKGGMYYAAEYFSNVMGENVSPFVMRYLSHKFSWKRVVDESLPIVQGIIKGSMPASYYRHIIIPGIDGQKSNTLSAKFK